MGFVPPGDEGTGEEEWEGGNRGSEPASERTEGPAFAFDRFLSRELALFGTGTFPPLTLVCERDTVIPVLAVPFDEPASRESRELLRVAGGSTGTTVAPLLDLDSPGTPLTTLFPLVPTGPASSS